jgi:hypothetical protein
VDFLKHSTNGDHKVLFSGITNLTELAAKSPIKLMKSKDVI